MELTIGGDRLGSGNKMKAHLRNYERSTHDLSYIFRTTMSSGTLVPFMSEVALPGDTFDINLNCNVLTHPTKGPLFGSYKVQLDVFQVPVRLYHASLHNNKLEVGRKMSTIKLPQIEVIGLNNAKVDEDLDNYQVNPSSILSYLNIRGIGFADGGETTVYRHFNSIPYLAYWDIYKNYYANKQEEIGAYIHNRVLSGNVAIHRNYTGNTSPDNAVIVDADITIEFMESSYLRIHTTTPIVNCIASGFTWLKNGVIESIISSFRNFSLNTLDNSITFFEPELSQTTSDNVWIVSTVDYANDIVTPVDGKPEIKTFPLSNIDLMRTELLQFPDNAPYMINESTFAPYGSCLEFNATETDFSIRKTQEGLALKTYQSDLFNNWLSSEWIDGSDGISAVTAIDTSEGSFTIDELNMSKKVYDMLNRIALSGGSYYDWVSTVYDHTPKRGMETPVYVGGLIRELAFQEVISNARSNDEPLGTLAGRGVMTNKHKGGKIIVKCDEPCYIIGLVSLTPRIDYSQGNKWDVNLKTMDDFHKPALDEIGFQDLITDQMAYWNTEVSNGSPSFRSAGKQPAWINYMTNTNVVRGNFAVASNQMFMTLNRRYTPKSDGNFYNFADLTTYIDPSKFNHIFADSSLDAQNFWTQISCDITARRKMSAKVIPNL